MNVSNKIPDKKKSTSTLLVPTWLIILIIVFCALFVIIFLTFYYMPIFENYVLWSIFFTLLPFTGLVICIIYASHFSKKKRKKAEQNVGQIHNAPIKFCPGRHNFFEYLRNIQE